MTNKEIDADDIPAIPISGKMTSPKACAGGGLPEHWTAIEARRKHETTIRKDERERVLDELLKILNEEIGLENLPVITRRLQELRRVGESWTN